MDEVTIREFQSGDESAWRRLNEDWITRHFTMEPADEAALLDPHGHILNKGGAIYFAIQNGQPVGCCALKAMGPGEFELSKMTVKESMRGAGIGRRLLVETVEAARRLGARRLYLETNAVLAPAIRLYESLGFRHLPPERVPVSPYVRANVFMEMDLV